MKYPKVGFDESDDNYDILTYAQELGWYQVKKESFIIAREIKDEDDIEAIPTSEGINDNILVGDMICVNIDADNRDLDSWPETTDHIEQYTQKKKDLLDAYKFEGYYQEPVDALVKQKGSTEVKRMKYEDWVVYVPQGDYRLASQIDKTFEVQTTWSDTPHSGTAGDWLVTNFEILNEFLNETDPAEVTPNDVWIVDQESFNETYKVIEEVRPKE